ncbi:hypothetical protein HY642_03450 [Candidatus Woesearchaeota archaeon]|nr:hypothetical protein [Candidatus Woesearchaeota archaeon]
MLLIIGIMTVMSNKRAAYAYIALMPLLFAAQQFSEGMVWLMPASAFVQVFLLLALVLWPVWMPVSVWKAERTGRRKILLVGVIAGAVWAVLALVLLTGTTSQTIAGHIRYEFPAYESLVRVVSPLFPWLTTILYALLTVGPLLIATDRRLRWLGGLFLAAGILSYAAWSAFFVSVWCFFAALISGAVLYIVRSTRYGDRLGKNRR